MITITQRTKGGAVHELFLIFLMHIGKIVVRSFVSSIFFLFAE